MASPVNSALPNAALRTGAQHKSENAELTAGQKPYTRSSSVALNAGEKPGARTSMESPHVAGAPGKLGKERVNLDPNGFPTHLLFTNSNGEVGVALKVKREKPAEIKPTAE